MRTEIKIAFAAALITMAVWFVVYRLGLNPHLSKRGYYGETSTLVASELTDAQLVRAMGLEDEYERRSRMLRMAENSRSY